MELLQSLNAWHWAIGGLVLLALEVILPGVLFLWLGLAAMLVAAALAIAPDIGWQAQWIAFGIASLVLTVLWHSVLKRRPSRTDRPVLNRRAEQYIGRVFTLTEPIKHGRGKVRVDDTMWKISGPNSKAGDAVRVTGVDGSTLRVEAAEQP